MDDAVVQQVRAAYARLAGGDLDSFAEVLDPDVHWRGVVSGIVRKRHAY
jgi:ketosteroid isomerase-like protein